MSELISLDKLPQTLTSIQDEILTGTLLGDARLHVQNKKSGNPQLAIKRMLSDRPYLEWQASFFQDFTKRPVHELTYHSSRWDKNLNKYIPYLYTAANYISRCVKAFDSYHKKWYPNHGKKIVPKDLVLTPLIIAEWLCDDGCVSLKENKKSLHIDFATMCFTKNDIEFLHSLLESRYNERFFIGKDGSIRCSDAPARLLLKDIDSIFPESMSRKSNIWRNSNIELYTAPQGMSLLKKQDNFKKDIEYYLNNHNIFSMLDLAKYIGCARKTLDGFSPDYIILNKYLKEYKDSGKIYKDGIKWKVRL